jgi:hypothetical protein
MSKRLTDKDLSQLNCEDLLNSFIVNCSVAFDDFSPFKYTENDDANYDLLKSEILKRMLAGKDCNDRG